MLAFRLASPPAFIGNPQAHLLAMSLMYFTISDYFFDDLTKETNP